MRKFSMLLRWKILIHPSYAILLILALFCTIGHAQCLNVNFNVPSSFSLSPNYWAPGQSYNVVLTDNNSEFYLYPVQPIFYIFNQAEYNSGNYYQEDPSVTKSALTYVKRKPGHIHCDSSSRRPHRK